VHVPYKGGPQVLQDVISGQIEMTSLPLTESLPQARANRIRALAQTGEKRSSIAPDIPTVDEAGLKGYAVTTWYVIFGPAGMPGDVVKKLHAELVKALKSADVQERLKSVGVGDIIGSTPEQAAQFVNAESVRWAEVIRASGAKAD
jgi:tripartite-type tricarboxylate transporter receptor subunit TctC